MEWTMELPSAFVSRSQQPVSKGTDTPAHFLPNPAVTLRRHFLLQPGTEHADHSSFRDGPCSASRSHGDSPHVNIELRKEPLP